MYIYVSIVEEDKLCRKSFVMGFCVFDGRRLLYVLGQINRLYFYFFSFLTAVVFNTNIVPIHDLKCLICPS